jgi:glycosyltransferase involved in cell wall biosynthesis
LWPRKAASFGTGLSGVIALPEIKLVMSTTQPLTGQAAPSVLMVQGSDDRNPAISITIPTFRRFAMLREAVESALAQQSARVIEVVVVDNDPESTAADRLLLEVPQIKDSCFRYYRNSENIGMFGNWNRCIELGRGHWHTMLHDDDLLDPTFVETMLDVLEAQSPVDAIACRKRNLDQRLHKSSAATSSPESNHSPVARWRQRLIDLRRFGLADYRSITPRNLFWANPLGNPIGFVCRKVDAITAGGYNEHDYPSGDHFFYARFSRLFRLIQHRRVEASYRISVNETLSEPVIRRLILSTHRLQKEYVGSVVPAWWRYLIPLATACEIEGWNRFWGVNINRADIERSIGAKLPRANKRLYNAVLALLGGF